MLSFHAAFKTTRNILTTILEIVTSKFINTVVFDVYFGSLAHNIIFWIPDIFPLNLSIIKKKKKKLFHNFNMTNKNIKNILEANTSNLRKI